MKTLSTALAALAIIASGFGIVAVSTWNNLEMLAGKNITIGEFGQFFTDLNSVTAVPLAVALFTPVLMAAGHMALRRWRIVMALCLIVPAIGGVVFDLATSLDRVATNNDAIKHEKRSHNAALAAASEAITRWEDRLATAKAGIDKECGGKDPAKLTDAGWPSCRNHWRQATAAQSALDEARTQRASLGADVVEDSGAVIAAGMFSGLGVTPALWSRYKPVFPVIFLLGGSFLVSFGFSLMTPVRVATAQPATAAVARPMKNVTPTAVALPTLEESVVALVRDAGKLNNGQLAGLMVEHLGYGSDATASRRVKELCANGLLKKRQVGKEVEIEVA